MKKAVLNTKPGWMLYLIAVIIIALVLFLSAEFIGRQREKAFDEATEAIYNIGISQDVL